MRRPAGNADGLQPRISSLQQDRSRRTRERLVTAAHGLWLDRGFDASTVAAIAETAGVSKGTFYFYFLRKEDLLLHLALETSARAWQDWERLRDGETSTEETLHRLIDGISHRCERSPKALLARTMREVLASLDRWAEVRSDRPDFARVFASVFARGQRRGEISRSRSSRELAAMLTILIVQALLDWSEADGHDTAPLEQALWRRTTALLEGAKPRTQGG